MRGIRAAALIAFAAASAVGDALSPGDTLQDFKDRVSSYLEDTPEDLSDKDRTADRKALMKAIAAIDKVEAKPSDLAIVKVIQKQAKALAKEIPNGEMAGLLDQVASNASDTTDGLLQAFRDELEGLPPSPAGDALLAKLEPLEDAFVASQELESRDETLKELVKVVKALGKLEKKIGGVLKGLDGLKLLEATVNGSGFTTSAAFGAFVVTPGGDVVSLTFSGSAPNGSDTESFVFAIDSDALDGFIVPGTYLFGTEIPVATAVYSRQDSEMSPVLTILGVNGEITILGMDPDRGTIRGTFQFSDENGTVSGGTFFLTGMPALPAPSEE